MKNSLRRFWHDEAGAEMVEWAVVTVILLVATVPVLLLLRGELVETFKSILLKLQENPPEGWGSPPPGAPAATPTP